MNKFKSLARAAYRRRPLCECSSESCLRKWTNRVEFLAEKKGHDWGISWVIKQQEWGASEASKWKCPCMSDLVQLKDIKDFNLASFWIKVNRLNQ